MLAAKIERPGGRDGGGKSVKRTRQRWQGGQARRRGTRACVSMSMSAYQGAALGGAVDRSVEPAACLASTVARVWHACACTSVNQHYAPS
jgi:hypothetical protein